MSAEPKTDMTAAERGLTEAFAKLHAGLAHSSLRDRREAAFRRFEAQGLPHRRVEEWKYTDLRTLMRDAKPLESIARRLASPESTPNQAKGTVPAIIPRNGGDGEVTLVMMLDIETEVEMRLPGRFKVSPQIAGALKAVPGVVDVQTV